MVNAYLKLIDSHHTEIIRLLEGIAIAATVPFDAEGAIPSIVEYSEGVNLAWNQVDQYAKEVNETIDQAKSTYTAGSRGMQDIKKKVAFINSTVEKHKSNMPIMSYNNVKRGKGLGLNPSPGSMPRQTERLVNEQRATSGRKAAVRQAHDHFVLRSPNTPVTTSALSSNISYHDSHLIEGPSEKSLTAINVKIGKQLYPDVITPFLKNLSGHGKIRMQFAGRCISKVDERHTHMQIFRHRLSAGTNFTGAAWPDGTPGTADYILGPQNTTIFKVDGGGPSTVSTGFAVNTTSFRDIINKQTYWAPYNKADLEDLSWNLNSLKVNNALWDPPAASVEAVAVQGGDTVTIPVTGGVAQGVGFQTNVDLFQSDDHARQSAIAQNNKTAVVLPPSTADARLGAYRYNAVFNKGSVEYDFMNKGTGGAKVELIIYRLKKDYHYGVSASNLGNAPGLTNSLISDAIGAGYLETCVEKGGTDALLGRPPVASDVSVNPAFPFLPTLKKTVGSTMPFVEISRQTFAMPSGSRRSVTLQLPGEVYDPANIATRVTTTTANLDYPGILDVGSYCIMMSVCGARCTKEVACSLTTQGVPKGDYNIGDMFAAANIQFYGTYTEHMGACQYKAERAANIYTQGALLDPAPPTSYTYTPVTMLPSDCAVRVGMGPGQTPGSGASNLGHHFDAEATAIPS